MSLGKLLDRLVRTNNSPMWLDESVLADAKCMKVGEFIQKYQANLEGLYASLRGNVLNDVPRADIVMELNEYMEMLLIKAKNGDGIE